MSWEDEKFGECCLPPALNMNELLIGSYWGWKSTLCSVAAYCVKGFCSEMQFSRCCRRFLSVLVFLLMA